MINAPLNYFPVSEFWVTYHIRKLLFYKWLPAWCASFNPLIAFIV